MNTSKIKYSISAVGEKFIKNKINDSEKFENHIKKLRHKRINNDLDSGLSSDKKVLAVKEKLVKILKPFSPEEKHRIMRAVGRIFS